MLSACASTDKLIVREKLSEGELTSEAGLINTKESNDFCYGPSSNKKSWKCRILDGKSYVIASNRRPIDTRETSVQTTPLPFNIKQLDESQFSIVKDFLRLNDKFYAVQIFASSSRTLGIDFIDSNRLGRARLLLTKVNGRDWYVALLGVYPTLQLANKRAKAYGEVHPGLTPWVRSVKSLKLVYKQVII